MLNSNDNLSEVWFMDEGAGLNRVGSHNGYVFTDVNSLASPAGVDGLCAQAIEGNNEYLKIPAPIPVDLRLGGDIDWCIHFNYRPDGDFAARQYLISRLLLLGNKVEFHLQYMAESNNKLRLNISDDGTPGGYVTVDSPTALTDSTWGWVFIGHDSVNNLITAGVNNSYNTTPHATGMYDNGADVRFDCFLTNAAVGSLGATGSIDNLYVWKNKFLTTDQRAAIYTGEESYPFGNEREKRIFRSFARDVIYAPIRTPIS